MLGRTAEINTWGGRCYQGILWARFPRKGTAMNADIYCWKGHRVRGRFWAHFSGKSTVINAEIYYWSLHRVWGWYWAHFPRIWTIINADLLLGMFAACVSTSFMVVVWEWDKYCWFLSWDLYIVNCAWEISVVEREISEFSLHNKISSLSLVFPKVWGFSRVKFDQNTVS